MFDVVWNDQSFDPKLKAFYYVRVLEIPTLHWPDMTRFALASKCPIVSA
jgi:Protein of unknown function (DUF3604)